MKWWGWLLSAGAFVAGLTLGNSTGRWACEADAEDRRADEIGRKAYRQYLREQRK